MEKNYCLRNTEVKESFAILYVLTDCVIIYFFALQQPYFVSEVMSLQGESLFMFGTQGRNNMILKFFSRTHEGNIYCDFEVMAMLLTMIYFIPAILPREKISYEVFL